MLLQLQSISINGRGFAVVRLPTTPEALSWLTGEQNASMLIPPLFFGEYISCCRVIDTEAVLPTLFQAHSQRDF